MKKLVNRIMFVITLCAGKIVINNTSKTTSDVEIMNDYISCLQTENTQNRNIHSFFG